MQLANTSAYRPLSAFKTQEIAYIINIVEVICSMCISGCKLGHVVCTEVGVL